MSFGAAIALVSPADAAKLPVELVPSLGLRNGASLAASMPGVPPAEADPSLSLGLAVDWFIRPDAWFEVFVDHQKLEFTASPAAFGASRFDLDVDYLQFGGGYEPGEGRVRGYVAAAIGLTHYGADAGTVERTIAASGSLAGGFKVPMGQRAVFRFEVRGYATLSDAAVSVACGAGCLVQFAGNGWYQLGASAGVAVRLP
jgi:hypothetical protein